MEVLSLPEQTELSQNPDIPENFRAQRARAALGDAGRDPCHAETTFRVIVNVSSGTARMNLPDMSAYAGTKRMVAALSLAAREELEKRRHHCPRHVPLHDPDKFRKKYHKDRRPGRGSLSPHKRTEDTENGNDDADRCAEVIDGLEHGANEKSQPYTGDDIDQCIRFGILTKFLHTVSSSSPV